ncbi:hypothetical protein D3C79_877760 [compost metagenome]
MTPVVDAQVLAELQKSVMAGTVSAETYWQYLTTGKLPERPYDEEAELIGDDHGAGGVNLDREDRDETGANGGREAAGAGEPPLGAA